MIGILGAGAFGTALAVSLAQTGPVMLWGRGTGAWAQARENPRLPGVRVPQTVSITRDPEQLCGSDITLVCVPMQTLGAVLSALPRFTMPLVACCKGVDLNSGQDAGQILAQHSGCAPALMTGPSFAADIAQLLPTALTLACADPALGAQLQKRLTTPNLRLYPSADIRGAALGGALKNVVAIACGTAIGAGLGASARAALMTRGFAEMQRFAIARGAQAETLMGLSGLGDLALTCTSDKSRNYRYGVALGAGTPFEATTTVEGAATARALRDMPNMPITQTVAALVAGDTTAANAVEALMARPLKEE